MEERTLEDFFRLSESIRELTRKREELKKEITEYLKKEPSLIQVGSFRVSLFKGSRLRFDSDRLKADFPEAFSACSSFYPVERLHVEKIPPTPRAKNWRFF